jgi:hypothetical protein
MLPKTILEKNLEVDWFEVDNNSVLISGGVYLVGYLDGVLIGFNEVLLGDLVKVVDENRVLEKKYEKLRIQRRSNEMDLSARYHGLRQPLWDSHKVWRVVSVNPDGSFGVSLRLNQNNPDLFVRPDQVIKENYHAKPS